MAGLDTPQMVLLVHGDIFYATRRGRVGRLGPSYLTACVSLSQAGMIIYSVAERQGPSRQRHQRQAPSLPRETVSAESQ